MSSFYADLHVHSRFSRATSRDCDLPNLARWGLRKGLAVMGTGDFTHPGWLSEIRRDLVPAEPGLFRLNNLFDRRVQEQVPPTCRRAVRFMLQAEISTIYKRDDRTRKVHHLVYAPTLEIAERIVAPLARIGNIAADGRPILGLDSRNLLEIVLQAGEGAFLVPAHVWTPWFSALGSKSGFDSIADCYADMAGQVFAVETGLSSDPPMNWRLSALDRYRLVSNSDAHSPEKLAREACVFETGVDYHAMRRALATGRGYGGTVEFFPEEGKYHLDGHRKCDVRLTPAETRAGNGLCPVCGKPVTVGVMHRVEELADRPAGERRPGAAPFRSLIPLDEILGEIFGVGAASKQVRLAREALAAAVGPELFVLERAPLDDLRRIGSPLLAEAVERMRSGRVIRRAGYDGAYGAIRVFDPSELKPEQRHALLFSLPEPPASRPSPRPAPPAASRPPPAAFPPRHAAVRESPAPPSGPELFGVLFRLDPEQRLAASVVKGPLLVVAGPGTGKTRTLTHRIAYLVQDQNVPPERCLAVTFTRRAAAEMRARLDRLIPQQAPRVPVMTFHALGCAILAENAAALGWPRPPRVLAPHEQLALVAAATGASGRKAARLLRAIAASRRAVPGNAPEAARPPPDPEIAAAREAYERALRESGSVDFDDLILMPLRLLEASRALTDTYRDRYRWVCVDEYQDIDALQYRLIKRLVPPHGNLCAIGDPDQAIYGFRGGDVRFFQRFTRDFPAARVVTLARNYRSSRAIVAAALQAIAPATLVSNRDLRAVLEGPPKIVLHRAATDEAEAEFVVHTVERLIGGATFFSLDSGRADAADGRTAFSFADFAVLYRTEAQAPLLQKAFARSGMPFQHRTHAPLLETPLVRAIVEAMAAAESAAPAPPEPLSVAARLDAVAAAMPDDRRAAAAAAAAILRPLAARCGSLDQFRRELALGVDGDLWDPRADAVSLLTLHSAKGLEFAVVFIVGCEDGVLPLQHAGDGDDATAAEEERRLFFVGMTRARDRLYLCHAGRRRWRGAAQSMHPSRFLEAIEEQLLERSQTRRRAARRPQEQLSLFDAV